MMPNKSSAQSTREVGIIGTTPYCLKLAMRMASMGLRVHLVDETLHSVQSGLQEIAAWAETNVQDGLLAENDQGRILRNIEIGCAFERLNSADLVIVGEFLSDRPRHAQEDRFRLLEAITPTELPIMVRLETAREIESILRIAPSPKRIVPFLSIFSSYLPKTIELAKTYINDESILNVAEECLRSVGFLTLRFSSGDATPLQRLFLRSFGECCSILVEEEQEPHNLDNGLPIGALGGLGPFISADLIGLENILKMDAEAGNILSDDAMLLLAGYLRTDRTGVDSGEGFYLYKSATK